MEGDPEGYELRFTEVSDGPHLKEWLMDNSIGRWFPMFNEMEIDDAVMRWVGFHKFDCSLTALDPDNNPCGIVTLYLQPYKKLAHQAEFGIIVGGDHRGKGLGTMMLKNIMHLGKTKFNLELLHLQVYDGNPAVSLYKRLGFREYGKQTHWIKEDNEYLARIFMERFL